MDESLRNASEDEQENTSSDIAKVGRNRHSPYQITRLEEIFTKLTHPDEKQRCEIGKELGLETKQVKFWFQNKRTQQKAHNEKADTVALRAENEKITNENNQMKEQLKTMLCSSCDGKNNHADHQIAMQQLRLENARLREEHERISKLIARNMENDEKPSLGDNVRIGVGSSSRVPQVTGRRSEIEKAMMLETGIAAKEELLKLLSPNMPFWVKSQVDQRLVLHQQNYETVFPKVNHFNGVKARVESSKDARIVKIQATQLVDMFLDSEKWANLFPTIVTKAQIIEVLERGSTESRSGALLLMYEKMHVLSPLVAFREFRFLRYCVQLDPSTWVIAKVSYDLLKEDQSHSSIWMFPSGCIIHQVSTDSSQVSWVEHVEVVDKIRAHPLYRDLVQSNVAFGAERWVLELQRMCERIFTFETKHLSVYDCGVVTLPEAKRSIMQLSNRMVKDLCGVLSMLTKPEFPENFIDADYNGIRLSVKRNGGLNQPSNVSIVVGASSTPFPLPSKILFDFLKDPSRRFEWDVICHGDPWHKVAHISTGNHFSNYISIIQPMEPPPPEGVVIIQECFINPLGSYVVYSPVNIPELNIAFDGQDSSAVSLLSSGFVITEDSHSLFNARTSNRNGGTSAKPRGSLLTVAFQILMSNAEVVNLERTAAAVNSLINTTVDNIRDALFKI